ncbi:thiolase family protein [Thalassobacillus hwangdonensis]|uniref:acetyl-CoA C-acetyltransferase n=1 Tax=Thalassobacillus hwangdonensis TaxID=546108 RepID=A0ABW3L3Y6_9BACI
MKEVVIVDATRTPIGKLNGMLKDVSAKDLAKTVMESIQSRTKFDLASLDEIIVGNVDAPSNAPNIGRVAALELGWPLHIPSYIVGQNCASSLQAFMNGVQSIQAGNSQMSLIVGTENMSQIPYVIRGARDGFKMGDRRMKDSLLEMLVDPVENISMGETAQILAEEYEIDREQQDEYALRSVKRAWSARDEGIVDYEITPVTIQDEKMSQDELNFRDLTLEQLSKLKPAFKSGGSVTPGNTCGMNDGAAALLMMSKDKAEQLGLRPIAKVRSFASVGVDPKRMGLGPVRAIPKALEKADLEMEDIDLFEVNEAFAAQTLACIQELGIDQEKLNPLGGAIALGHPVGATGVRLLVTLLNGLRTSGKKYGVASLCVGGGLGGAVVIERMEE